MVWHAVIPADDARMLQVCVPTDCRRRLYGAAIVGYVEEFCRRGGAVGVWHKCAWDLESNEFWQALGYYCTGQVHGGIKRNRLLNVWRKDFIEPLLRVEAPAVRGVKDRRRYEAMYRSGKVLVPFGYKQSELVEWNQTVW